jgi:dephospho-CoA kinase
MLIGLTGGIASGKSTIAEMFEKRGIPVVSADLVYREEIIKPDTPVWKEIVDYFGEDILLANREIDRKKLGNIVFHNWWKRRHLNKITHPSIIRQTMKNASELEREHGRVLVEFPLLYETKAEMLFDLVVVVFTDMQKQVERLMKRDQISEQEALYRIHSQTRIRRNIRKGDIIIYNNNDLATLEAEVERVFDSLDSLKTAGV